MVYTISIDWLAIHCHYIPKVEPFKPFAEDKRTMMEKLRQKWTPKDGDPETCDIMHPQAFRYKMEQYGTRSFSELWRVSVHNAEGGWDDFAEVQACPYSGILQDNSVIVRFVNRALYTDNFWQDAEQFLSDNSFEFKGISRIDICGDFNQFKTMTARQLIEGFASKKFRHIGQGVGALYFNHGVMRDKETNSTDYGVKYTGLSFGTHASDLRVYLYNKSFELLTQGDKPWIRDRWSHVGLDVLNVWRLEVSIKSKAVKFKDRTSGKVVTIDKNCAANDDELGTIYHTLVQKKFDFRVNNTRCTNVSRLERIQLFDLHPVYDHRTIRNISPGGRFEKMFIKALYLISDIYRGQNIADGDMLAQSLAFDIARATDLEGWMTKKVTEWEKPNHK